MNGIRPFRALNPLADDDDCEERDQELDHQLDQRSGPGDLGGIQPGDVRHGIDRHAHGAEGGGGGVDHQTGDNREQRAEAQTHQNAGRNGDGGAEAGHAFP